ncbi:hypothetical protein PGTUg99_025938 [Puccinia graminis f. sp. tritici]|uniref:Chitin-binding type-2 domain-containing protein n=1 Tax=Puccinia graminis f. sp. tritici TaxID=56615 RepID=A0A5B0MCI5_PUCGR|nr:hypothetical protein PGTUg99_025938 [Puccinia graminis f. sp. tritici]
MMLPLKALSCILALPSLIGASSPGAHPPPTGCLHSNRIPETKVIPCPATYTCYSGYKHPCPNWLRSRSLTCDNCGDVKLDYTEACERAPRQEPMLLQTTPGMTKPRISQPLIQRTWRPNRPPFFTVHRSYVLSLDCQGDPAGMLRM